MKKKRKKPGKKPLAPGERTVRVTTNLAESLAKRARRRAGKAGLSAYLRTLVEGDLARAG